MAAARDNSGGEVSSALGAKSPEWVVASDFWFYAAAFSYVI
ncbi:MAG: hypothetical protein ACXWMT_08815 [Candidatus Binataceae bacterium]